MAQLLRNLSSDTVAQLKVRAERNGRSLQGEVKVILEAAAPMTMAEARQVALEWQRRLAGTIQSDSTDLIREDRDR